MLTKSSALNALIVCLVFILLLTIFLIDHSTPANPSSIDVSTFNCQWPGDPRRADPARAYDSLSRSLIFNVYEPLIFYGDKKVLPSTTANVSAFGYSDLSILEPLLAESLPTITEDRLNWTFIIRSGVRFHPWKAANGTLITNQELTAEDVEYTFKRMLVQDQYGAPSWMFCLPATGYMFLDNLDPNPDTNGFDGNEATVAAMIDNFVTVSGNNVTLHFKMAWAENMLKQIFCQTWGCIVNKAFCIEHGCWNGTFYPGWSTDYRRMPSSLYSPLDRYYSKSKYSPSAPDVPNMCGTGPYRLRYWNQTAGEYRLDKFADYWRGWTGNHLETMVATKETSVQTTKMKFLKGDYDVITIPAANTKDLLSSTDPYVPLPGLTMYYDCPALSIDTLGFTLTMSWDSSYLPRINGILVNDFFGNVHVRRAFAAAFNFTEYEIYRRDQFAPVAQPASWWLKGLTPDYENKSLTPHIMNTTDIQNELSEAYFPAGGGQSVWETGFQIYLIYRDDYEKKVLEIVAANFAGLGSKFKCTLAKYPEYPTLCFCELDPDIWPNLFDGWIADFADPDNLVRPFMHSYGDFAYFHHYNDPHVNQLIDQGLLMPDGLDRNNTYQELQYIYWRDVPGIPIGQPLGYWFARDWVRGWYFNPTYPGAYLYDLYKEAPSSTQDVDVSVMIEPVRTYPVIQAYHGEMRRGMVGQPSARYLPAQMVYNVTVTRTDNNSAIPLLHVAVGLTRTNGSIVRYPNCTYVVLSPNQTITLQLTWYEDGVNDTIAAGNWTIGAEAWSTQSDVNDINSANNYDESGIVEVVALISDVNGDGLVDIFDAIRLATTFGASTGEKRYYADADLNSDGTIDIYDSIILAADFNKHVP